MRKRLLPILCILMLAVVCFSSIAVGSADEKSDADKLQFLILGPDPRMPMRITYADFTNGTFELNNLQVGTYSISELNADGLVNNYTFDATRSVQVAVIEVKADGTTDAGLLNVYTRTPPTPTPSPVPTPAPTNTPTPATGMTNLVVKKEWVDNNNADGNRPATVTVHLFADGTEIDKVTLDKSNGWQHVFANLPLYSAGTTQISYTITEDPVPLYVTTVNGLVIVNTYQPTYTSASVQKVWVDNNDAAGLRPKNIVCVLSNGIKVTLSAANNWSATVNNLPTIVNGQPAVYTWTEQSAPGYALTNTAVNGSTTVFTNTLKTKKPLKVIDDDIPLGVDVIINHVGDCFD